MNKYLIYSSDTQCIVHESNDIDDIVKTLKIFYGNYVSSLDISRIIFTVLFKEMRDDIKLLSMQMNGDDTRRSIIERKQEVLKDNIGMKCDTAIRKCSHHPEQAKYYVNNYIENGFHIRKIGEGSISFLKEIIKRSDYAPKYFVDGEYYEDGYIDKYNFGKYAGWIVLERINTPDTKKK